MGQVENNRRYREKHKIKENKYHKIRLETRRKIEIPFGEKCAICHKKYATERHHLDYLKPFKVLFLCINCHRQLHKFI